MFFPYVLGVIVLLSFFCVSVDGLFSYRFLLSLGVGKHPET